MIGTLAGAWDSGAILLAAVLVALAVEVVARFR